MQEVASIVRTHVAAFKDGSSVEVSKAALEKNQEEQEVATVRRNLIAAHWILLELDSRFLDKPVTEP